MPRIFLTLFLLFLSSTALAEEPAVIRQQIEDTLRDIVELQKLQQKLEQEQDSAQKRLRDTEVEIGRIEKQAESLRQEIDKNESNLQELDKKKSDLGAARLEQQHLVASQARVTYQNGRQEYLKLLLNQQQPERFSRILTYYEYLSQARLQQIAAFNQTLSQLSTVEREVSQQQEQLSARQERLKQQQSELVQLRETRRATLATLNREYKTQTQKIQARRKEHQQLEQNLKRVEEVLAQQARIAEEARRKAQEQARAQQQAAAAAKAQQRQAASETEPAEPRPTTAVASASTSSSFAAQRGRLPWPINGALLARYGEQRGGDARMTWDGVLIQASVGTPVKAIHAGRVVFADWLRGAGLLVIVDHGNGYLSLYGHNQTLLRTAGDVVRVGDPIATVGNSGGQEQAALYFAIRHQGRPSDPAQWCHAQG